jgi:hypothetical protein
MMKTESKHTHLWLSIVAIHGFCIFCACALFMALTCGLAPTFRSESHPGRVTINAMRVFAWYAFPTGLLALAIKEKIWLGVSTLFILVFAILFAMPVDLN